MSKADIPSGKPIKSNERILRQIEEVKASVEDMRDYLDLLEARIRNKGRRRYSLEHAKKRLNLE